MTAPNACISDCLSLSGAVIEDVSGLPLAGVEVMLMRKNGSIGRRTVASIETNTLGNYRFSIAREFVNYESLVLVADHLDYIVDSVSLSKPLTIQSDSFEEPIVGDIHMRPYGFINLNITRPIDRPTWLNEINFSCTPSFHEASIDLPVDTSMSFVIPAEREVCFKIKYRLGLEEFQYEKTFYHKGNEKVDLQVNL